MSGGLGSKLATDIGIIDGSGPRGIPKVAFIEDPEKFLTKAGMSADEVIAVMNELYNKFKYFEMERTKQKGSLKGNAPDMTKTIQMVKFLQERADSDEPTVTNFCMADTIYAQAELDNSNTVCLWLGANVLMEFSYEEALKMLSSNLDQNEKQLADVSEDLDFLKDQITMLEVTISRVYNYTVKLKREAALASGGAKAPAPHAATAGSS